MLGRGTTRKSKAPLPTLPLPAAKGGPGSSSSVEVSTKLAAPVVPSHARQRHYQQIKYTPPNPPLACGKGKARFLGIGRGLDQARRSGSAEPCSAGALPANRKPQRPSCRGGVSREVDNLGMTRTAGSRQTGTAEVRYPIDAQALPGQIHRQLRGLRHSHKPDLTPALWIWLRGWDSAQYPAAAEHGSALPKRSACPVRASSVRA